MWPAVIPISAENAFLYRTAYQLDIEDFKKLDPSLIDKIGREEVGRLRWKKLSQDEKYEAAYFAVGEDSQYKERLEATQFDKFLDILAMTCGGNSAQQRMIQSQIDVIVERHFSWESPMAENLLFIYKRCKAIGMPADTLRDAFWSECAKLEAQALSTFSSDMDMRRLVDSMGQLCDYFDRFVKPIYEGQQDVLNTEKALVVAAMERLIEYQFGVVLEMESKWNIMKCSMMVTPNVRNTRKESPFLWEKDGDRWKNKITKEVKESATNPGIPHPTWKLLSPQDWFTIIQSLLLLKHSKYFCQRFGREIASMERLASSGKAAVILLAATSQSYDGNQAEGGFHYHFHQVVNRLSEYSKGFYRNRVFTPEDETKYALVSQVEMPKDLTDPEHWGHLGWKLCEFMEKS